MPRFYVCALTDLVTSNRGFILAVARSNCRGDYQAAEDITQIAMMKAIFSPSPLVDLTKIKSWLKSITINAALNYFRKNRPLEPIDDLDLVGVTMPIEPDARIDEVKKRISRLPDKQKQAVEMHFYEDKTFSEISKELEVPYNTAKANCRHGTMKVKNSVRKLH